MSPLTRRITAALVTLWSAVAVVILGVAVYLLATGQAHAQTAASSMTTGEYLATVIALIVLGVVVLIAIVDHIRDRDHCRRQREFEDALRHHRHQRLNSRGQP